MWTATNPKKRSVFLLEQTRSLRPAYKTTLSEQSRWIILAVTLQRLRFKVAVFAGHTQCPKDSKLPQHLAKKQASIKKIAQRIYDQKLPTSYARTKQKIPWTLMITIVPRWF
jgi:hypothetical protein